MAKVMATTNPATRHPLTQAEPSERAEQDEVIYA